MKTNVSLTVFFWWIFLVS